MGQLAGLPKQVIRRAKDILAELEAGGAVSAPAASRKKSVGQNEASLQDSLDADKKKEFMLRLSDLQVETMTPLEALNVLFKAAKDARELID